MTLHPLETSWYCHPIPLCWAGLDFVVLTRFLRVSMYSNVFALRHSPDLMSLTIARMGMGDQSDAVREMG
jgi:hypothetical protein